MWNCLARCQVFGFKIITIAGQKEFALGLVAAGLPLAALGFGLTSLTAHTCRWILLVYRRPSWSDLFEDPLRRDFMVVAFLPKTIKKAKGDFLTRVLLAEGPLYL